MTPALEWELDALHLGAPPLRTFDVFAGDDAVVEDVLLRRRRSETDQWPRGVETDPAQALTSRCDDQVEGSNGEFVPALSSAARRNVAPACVEDGSRMHGFDSVPTARAGQGWRAVVRDLSWLLSLSAEVFVISFVGGIG